MKMKLFIWLIPCTILFINSCQKDDNSDNAKEIDICPEVAMGNFDEVGMILKDYLINQTSHQQSENLENLDRYLDKCNCLYSYEMSENKIQEFPAIVEYKLRFVRNSDTVNKTMDLFVFENGRIEFRKFHEVE
jgi:hypothetical protein